MEQENIINQGEDANVEFDVVDDAGAPIDITAASKAYVFLYYFGANVPAFKYSLTAATGYTLFSSTNPELVAGKIIVKLLTNQTKTAEPGKLYAEIGIQLADAGRTDDSLFDKVARDVYAATIKKSLTAITTLP